MHQYSIKRLTLALVIGLFVGFEREWRHKQAGDRTFTFVATIPSSATLDRETSQKEASRAESSKKTFRIFEEV